jgi:hypothetical protein
MTRKITLRIVAEDLCGESPTCPVRAKIDEDPNNTYFVGKTDIDPDVRAALADRIGPGEALFKVPNHVAGR